jgi:two-component system, response regulator YesN
MFIESMVRVNAMYRILVIDDESRQRKILSQVIKSFNRPYEVWEASNGQDALRLIQEMSFDIAICDIRMPLMDGLEFIKAVRKLNLSIRFVIVSGYGEFAYAKQAIGLQVSDYILKPIEEEQILQTLLKIENEITAQWQEKMKTRQIEILLHNMRPAYDEQLLRRWLFGDCTREECTEAQSLLPDTRRCVVMLLHLCGDTDEKAKGLSLSQDIADYFLTLGPVLCFWGQHNERIVVLGLDQECLHTETTHKIRFSLDKARQGLGMPIAIGVSSIQMMDKQGLVMGVEQAESTLAGLFYMPEQVLFYFDEVAYKLTNKLQRYPQREDSVFQIQTSDHDIQAIVENWLAMQIGEKWVRPDVLLGAICNSLLQYQHDLLQRFSMVNYLEKAPFSLANGIRMCESRKEATAILCRYFIEIQNFISQLGESRHTLVMEDCLVQLEKAFRADITLTSVASQYHFSPSYFSLLFKQYTGKSFINYMTSLRIKHASQLLETTSMKVYEIAQKVGFQDVKYFSRLFKKMQKVTPEEYRQLGAATKHRLD